MKLSNDKMREHRFLADMYEDGYFPDFLVDKGKDILVRLCEAIETVARDCIGLDFSTIATAYGFADADIEELIAPRNW